MIAGEVYLVSKKNIGGFTSNNSSPKFKIEVQKDYFLLYSQLNAFCSRLGVTHTNILIFNLHIAIYWYFVS